MPIPAATSSPEITTTKPKNHTNTLFSPRTWNFDVDKYLNPIIPPSPLPKLPSFVSRWFGYRDHTPEDVGNILAAVWSALGAFAGLAVVATIFNHVPDIQNRYSGVMIASFGASAILEYNTLTSPLGQPRNAVLGHTFSALVGVAISKLFSLSPTFALTDPVSSPSASTIQWIPSALACGLSSAIMLLTGTVHPPGGASAVLAASDPTIRAMGWYFVALVLFGTVVMVAVGLVVNNAQRRFPVYWWTAADLRQIREERRKRDLEVGTIGGVDGDHEIVEKGGRGVDDVDGMEKRREIDDAFALLQSLDLSDEESRILRKMEWRLRTGSGYEADAGRDEEEKGIPESTSGSDSKGSLV